MGQKYEASLAFLVEGISSLLVLATVTLFKSLQFNQARHNFNLPFKQFITAAPGERGRRRFQSDAAPRIAGYVHSDEGSPRFARAADRGVEYRRCRGKKPSQREK